MGCCVFCVVVDCAMCVVVIVCCVFFCAFCIWLWRVLCWLPVVDVGVCHRVFPFVVVCFFVGWLLLVEVRLCWLCVRVSCLLFGCCLLLVIGVLLLCVAMYYGVVLFVVICPGCGARVLFVLRMFVVVVCVVVCYCLLMCLYLIVVVACATVVSLG